MSKQTRTFRKHRISWHECERIRKALCAIACSHHGRTPISDRIIAAGICDEVSKPRIDASATQRFSVGDEEAPLMPIPYRERSDSERHPARPAYRLAASSTQHGFVGTEALAAQVCCDPRPDAAPYRSCVSPTTATAHGSDLPVGTVYGDVTPVFWPFPDEYMPLFQTAAEFPP
ncbi:unnamed protein product [Cylicocyclus nassatus]|uniref:Uncharacterized protein n=1 Tax=Cylicocyclus nassatus TaxID=53992 RepID=A0AA36M4H9_CYLNA|nr:unnamed protein product [Cylicocyclus nassatus]